MYIYMIWVYTSILIKESGAQTAEKHLLKQVHRKRLKGIGGGWP